jgi:hypothetical protein
MSTTDNIDYDNKTTIFWNYLKSFDYNSFVTHLTFGDKYNQQTILPNSVTHLTFGHDYNQSTILPNPITHLTFGYNYDQFTKFNNTLNF